MVLAGIAAAVLLSSSPAEKDRKPDGRNKRSQSRSPQRGTGCRGARSDRRSCVVGVDCGCIAEIATNLRAKGVMTSGWRQPGGGYSRLICASRPRVQTGQ